MANQIVIEVDYKDAIVKLNDLEGKIRDLRIPFEELGKANEQAASRVRAAVNSMGDAVAGSIKNLQRQRAEHINIAESLSKTNSHLCILLMSSKVIVSSAIFVTILY